MTQTELLKEIALTEHAGQFRNDGITPYTKHLEDVATLLSEAGECDELVAAGWGHDLFEDTKVTPQYLLSHDVSQRVVDTILLVSKKSNHTPEDHDLYIQKISENQWATKLKIADMLCNLACKPSKNQKKRYKRDIWFLFTKNEKDWENS